MELKLIRKFPRVKGFASSDHFIIMLTGPKVYVYRKADQAELACFSGLRYAYNAAISPDENWLVVKSTEPRLYLYSLTELRLIHEWSFRVRGMPQDEGFCFSPDSRYVYNLLYNPQLLTVLQKIDIATLEIADTYFTDTHFVFRQIEYNQARKRYVLCGYERILDEAGEQTDTRSCLLWFDGIHAHSRLDISVDMIRGCAYLPSTERFLLNDSSCVYILDGTGRVLAQKSVFKKNSRACGEWQPQDSCEGTPLAAAPNGGPDISDDIWKSPFNYIHNIRVSSDEQYLFIGTDVGLEVDSADHLEALARLDIEYGVLDIGEWGENRILLVCFSGHSRVYEIIC